MKSRGFVRKFPAKQLKVELENMVLFQVNFVLLFVIK
jgi:hypothetical protein